MSELLKDPEVWVIAGSALLLVGGYLGVEFTEQGRDLWAKLKYYFTKDAGE